MILSIVTSNVCFQGSHKKFLSATEWHFVLTCFVDITLAKIRLEKIIFLIILSNCWIIQLWSSSFIFGIIIILNFFVCGWKSHYRKINYKSAVFNQCVARIFKACSTWLFSQHAGLFSFRLSNKKMTVANTIVAAQCEESKLYLFLSSSKNVIHFLVCHRILVINLCMHEVKRLKTTGINKSKVKIICGAM